MSETSTPYTPASTSTTVAGNETVSLADEIKKYDTAKLIEYAAWSLMNIDMNKKKRKVDEALDPDYDHVFAELRKNVKRGLEVIVGLLKDRVGGSEEPTTKKRRVEEKIKKK
ncbi:hypothetical protein RclHR1_03030003 [Rhizophagus clarus]|uniref:Uncharacterized protein n=1 Tax=Rhizophagus clarus TaxID=94130 RepID=A0A2Z6RKI9_9GLOM|nr:hypothetical protein RclHR1_03030003 [Rhizophagus clarus]